MFTDYEDTMRLLYLNGSRNYEHISLLVCVLAEENPRLSTCYLNLNQMLK